MDESQFQSPEDWIQAYKVDMNEIKEIRKFLKNKCNLGKIPSSVPPIGFGSITQQKALTFVQERLKTNTPPFRLLIAGDAGTGKTFVLKKIRAIFKSKKKSCGVVALTGAVAHMIRGQTIHNYFGCPPYIGSFSAMLENNYSPPAAVWNKLLKLDALIIDEVFLIGLNALCFIDTCLKKVKRSSLPFGGCSVIMMGDVGQLDCIYDIQTFSGLSDLKTKLDPNQAEKRLLQTQQLYHHFHVIVLEGNFRTESKSYLEMLRRFRFKQVVQDDVNELSTRLSSAVGEEEKCKFSDAVVVFPTNRQCEAYAAKAIHDAGRNHFVFRSIPLSQNVILLPDKDFLLHVYKDAKVILTKNLSVSHGICNGSKGNIVRPVFHPKTGKLEFVVVSFEGYRGNTILGGIPVPIGREDIDGVGVNKFPLRQSIAMTLHKVQGSTLPKLVVNFTSREVFPNYSYVALSRQQASTNQIYRGDFVRRGDLQIQELLRLRGNLSGTSMERDETITTSFTPDDDEFAEEFPEWELPSDDMNTNMN